MSFRQTTAIQGEFTYESDEPAAVVVQPGRLRVHGSHVITNQRLEFAAGKGPAGGNFTARWLLNGVSLGTITVLNGAVDGLLAAPVVPLLNDGDLLTFEVLGLGGATGAVVAMLDTETPSTAGQGAVNGNNGLSILSGAGAPSNALGRNDEFYLDTNTDKLYGPKANGIWPAGVVLIGAGVPVGGTAGQELQKTSAVDFATAWVTPPSGSVYTYVKACKSADVAPNVNVEIAWDTLLEGDSGTALWNPGSNPARFKANAAGLWRLTVHSRWTGTATGATGQVGFWLNGGGNGALYSREIPAPAVVSPWTVEHSITMTMALNDYLSYVWAGTSGVGTFKGDAGGEFQWALFERIK